MPAGFSTERSNRLPEPEPKVPVPAVSCAVSATGAAATPAMAVSGRLQARLAVSVTA
jgi:hypothetical protein